MKRGYMDIMLTQAINQERTRRNLSSRQLANLIGVSPLLVEWAESGNQTVGQAVLLRIAEELELDPGEFPELGGGTPQADGPEAGDALVEDPPAAEPDVLDGTPPVAQPAALEHKPPSDGQKVEEIAREIDRFLWNWSRISGVHQHGDGKWHVPDGTKSPEELCRDATITGSCDRDTYPNEQHIVDAREGILVIHAAKPDPGYVRLELLPQGEHPDGNPAWLFEGSNPEDATIQFLSVMEQCHQDGQDGSDPIQILPPGTYRLVEAAGTSTAWHLDWVQYVAGTGWLDLLSYHNGAGFAMSESLFGWYGPTVPNQVPVDVVLWQEKPGWMQVCAYPMDGSGEIVLLNQDVGPEHVRLPADVDPGMEYIIAVQAKARWGMCFVDRETG